MTFIFDGYCIRKQTIGVNNILRDQVRRETFAPIKLIN